MRSAGFSSSPSLSLCASFTTILNRAAMVMGILLPPSADNLWECGLFHWRMKAELPPVHVMPGLWNFAQNGCDAP